MFVYVCAHHSINHPPTPYSSSPHSSLKRWAPVLGRTGLRWSRRLQSYTIVEKMQPKDYITKYKQPVGAIKDGSDCKMVTPRKSSTEARLLYGNKNKQQGCRMIAWSAAIGSSIMCTELFASRGEESPVY